MSLSLHFAVPVKPQTWKRVNIVTTKSGTRALKAKGDRAYQQTIAMHGLKARQSVPTWPLDATYGLIVWVTLSDRRSGDVDNYGKAVMDALNGTTWNDDRQVRSLHVILTEPGRPGLTIHVDVDKAAADTRGAA